jgi:hypothetical protein
MNEVVPPSFTSPINAHGCTQQALVADDPHILEDRPQ